MKALTALVTVCSPDTRRIHQTALIHRVYNSSIPGKLKRCNAFIKRFHFDEVYAKNHFYQIYFNNSIKSIKWLYISKHYDLLQSSVEMEEKVKEEGGEKLHIVPWPIREWLCQLLLNDYNKEHPLVREF
jgi:hypothetical protein